MSLDGGRDAPLIDQSSGIDFYSCYALRPQSSCYPS